MANIRNFSKGLATVDLTELEKSVGLIWMLTEIDSHKDCTAREIADFLHEQQFPRPNPTRLQKKLKDSKYTVRGNRHNSFRINRTYLTEIEERFSPLFKIKSIKKSDTIIPMEWLYETKRNQLIKLSEQINGTYDLGYFDATAVLTRRLMESLIILVYSSANNGHEIKKADGSFLGLEDLINKIKPDFSLSKKMPGYMKKIKDCGDIAAHDRSYITKEADIDCNIIRKTIHELMEKAGLIT